MAYVPSLIDTGYTLAGKHIEKLGLAELIIPKIGEIILSLSKGLSENFSEIAPGVFAAKDAKICESATLLGPTIISEGAEIRPGAYIRGCALIGRGAVIGNSTEIKNSIISDMVQLPHYNYVGDSILGYLAHLGAGAIISNFRLDHGSVKIRISGRIIDTGLRKMGAVIGSEAEIGCGAVISPGSIIGRRAVIYPLSHVRGEIEDDRIFDEKNTRVRKTEEN